MKTPSRATRALRAATALAGVLAVLALAAGPAHAHGGDGRVEVTSITRSGDEVTVTARITYVEDGHGVPDATVTLVVGEGTPVPMEPGAEEGDYTATVAAEAGASIRVTSVEPVASVEAVAPADEQAPTTAGGTTTTTAETTTTAPSSPADDDAPLDDEELPEPNGVDEAPEDGNGNLVVIAIVAVVVVAAVVAAVILRRKPAGGDGADGTDA